MEDDEWAKGSWKEGEEEGLCNDNDLKLSICRYRDGMVVHKTHSHVSHRPRIRFLKNQSLQP